jgi:hypothetical protein
MNTLLTENNYVYIPNFISSERAKLLASNFESFCEENKLTGDDQAPNSSSQYNYIDFLELLCNSTPEVGDFIGENVLPTYTYSRVYKKGSELLIHKDRDACEISLTVHLDGDKDWPIFIKNPKGETIKLNLKSGDAMLYLGCEAEHWREMYDGERYVQVFLHYVRSRGEKGYAYFDKEKIPKKINDNKNNTFEKNKKEEIVETKVNQPFILNSQSKLIDFINVFDDVVPHSLCDKILEEYGSDENFALAGVGSYEGKSTVNTFIRNVPQLLISDANIIDLNYEIRKKIDTDFFEKMQIAIQKYSEIHKNVTIKEDSGYSLLKYNMGNFYIEHVDSFKEIPRAVSCSIALNDDYDGGEFAFFGREIKYKIKKGSVLMFPSNYMYPHEVLPVTRGTRYSIVTWFI